MKLLHIITSLRIGGAEKLMVDLLPLLKASGHDVDLLLFDGEETPFLKELEKRGIKVFVLKKKKCFIYSPLHIFRLISFIRNYDIVHTHNTAPQFFTAIANIFVKTQICTTEHNTTNRRRNIPFFKMIDRWMYSQYNHIITISNQAEINLKEYIGKLNSPITTIFNGVDVNKFINAAPCRSLRKESKKNVIVMVAGFRPQKDQDTLIKSMNYLPLDDYELWLVGDGERKEQLLQLARDENVINNVRFLGLRDDVPTILKTADVIVMSSHYEGLSLSNIEGMCVGKPFIASDVDGLREITQNVGLLFEHENAKELAAIIARVINDKELYNKVSARCYSQAIKFDVVKMADGYLSIYEIISKH